METSQSEEKVWAFLGGPMIESKEVKCRGLPRMLNLWMIVVFGTTSRAEIRSS